MVCVIYPTCRPVSDIASISLSLFLCNRPLRSILRSVKSQALGLGFESTSHHFLAASRPQQQRRPPSLTFCPAARPWGPIPGTRFSGHMAPEAESSTAMSTATMTSLTTVSLAQLLDNP